MRWDGQNRTETGASLRPLGAIIGAEAYGADLKRRISERERRRFARILRHRRLLCFRRQNLASGLLKRYVAEFGERVVSGVLKAPANLDELQSVAFIDQDLLNRACVNRPEFLYRHHWRTGDVLVWTHRLRLTA